MLITSDMPDLFQFKTPSVRHLAWLCQAPQLIHSEQIFEPVKYLPENYLSTLQNWDNNPGSRPAVLNATPHYRLGYYVEALYACLITDVLGWSVVARNLPIRVDGITLGELDFLLHNPHTDSIEHHEIAIKFYLGSGGDAELPPGWYGPNPQDRLDIKTVRMLEQQSQRSVQPETLAVLAHHGIQAPTISRVFMPGYLFYPLLQIPALVTPRSVPKNHLRGHWLYLDDVTKTDTRTWVPLMKPHWLGPWIQAHAPDHDELPQTLADIKHSKTPRLFAVMQHDHISGLWKEADRVFVVPAQWPYH